MSDQFLPYDQWQNVDIRLGTIVEASAPEWSEKLLELHVDFGAEIGMRTVFSGIKAWYKPEDLQGRQALFLVNLPPRSMGGHMSEGMILAVDPPADEAGNSVPRVLLFDDLAPAGSKVR